MQARLGLDPFETPASSGLLRMRVYTGGALQRLLLMPAILAGELDAGLALWRLHPVRGAAFTADGLDAGITLLDDDGFLFHRVADQALGLLAQGLFRQNSSPPQMRATLIPPAAKSQSETATQTSTIT